MFMMGDGSVPSTTSDRDGASGTISYSPLVVTESDDLMLRLSSVAGFGSVVVGVTDSSVGGIGDLPWSMVPGASRMIRELTFCWEDFQQDDRFTPDDCSNRSLNEVVQKLR
uniref:(northern house mosquito) hypothetical protein n=1 Tax=Culex pipiens TaxID=7175 RepID=A0A8D8BMK0_CULPI